MLANATFSVIAASPSIPTSLGQVRVARDVANDEMHDNTRTSDEMLQTARHTPGFLRRRRARVHITKGQARDCAIHLDSKIQSLHIDKKRFKGHQGP